MMLLLVVASSSAVAAQLRGVTVADGANSPKFIVKPRPQPNLPPFVYLNTSYIYALEERARNATRAAHVNATLAAAAGVYRDKAKGRRLGLERSVFVTVLASGHQV